MPYKIDTYNQEKSRWEPYQAGIPTIEEAKAAALHLSVSFCIEPDDTPKRVYTMIADPGNFHTDIVSIVKH